ncbi:hypothetical protein CRYUN_Cryun33cG0057700 [Craigia yunnanensis]
MSDSKDVILELEGKQKDRGGGDDELDQNVDEKGENESLDKGLEYIHGDVKNNAKEGKKMEPEIPFNLSANSGKIEIEMRDIKKLSVKIIPNKELQKDEDVSIDALKRGKDGETGSSKENGEDKDLRSKEITKQHQPKWEGNARAELAGPKAEQVWPFLQDFVGLDKWFPTLTTCLPIEGISGQPGCVRFCAGLKTPVNGSDKGAVNWTKQKLLSIDPSEMVFSCSTVDGNVGFNSYISTVKLLPKEEGCAIERTYEVEPVKSWTLEDLDFFIVCK